jgi:hypothetical protein
VPFNSFAEEAPEPNPETKKKDVVWFALNDGRPLTAFAGIWAGFKGDRGTKSKPVPGPHLVFWVSDHLAQCHRRADPSEGHAGDPDNRGGARRLDARALGRGQGTAAALTG